MPAQPLHPLLPVGQVGVQKGFEDLAVVGGEEVDEFVDDDEFAALTEELEQTANSK